MFTQRLTSHLHITMTHIQSIFSTFGCTLYGHWFQANCIASDHNTCCRVCGHVATVPKNRECNNLPILAFAIFAYLWFSFLLCVFIPNPPESIPNCRFFVSQNYPECLATSFCKALPDDMIWTGIKRIFWGPGRVYIGTCRRLNPTCPF